MAKAYETSKKKKGNPYVATGLRSMQRQIKESLKNPETKAYYDDVKKRFKVGTTTEKKMRDRGLEGQDILEYYQREINIITGSYEYNRNKQFIANYIKAATKMGVPQGTIDNFNKYVTPENLNDVVRDLKGDIELAQIHYINEDNVYSVTNKMNREKQEQQRQDIIDTLNAVVLNIENQQQLEEENKKKKIANKITRNIRNVNRKIKKFGE